MSTLFPIVLEVEEASLGPVLRVLNGMAGVAKLHLDLESAPKKAMKTPKGPTNFTKKPKGGPRAKDIVLGLLLNGQQDLGALRAAVVAGGLHASNVNGVVTQLTGDGIIKRVGVGTYRLSEDAEAKLRQHTAPPPALPASAQEAAPVEKTKKFRPAIPGPIVVLRHLASVPKATRMELRDIMVKYNFKASSVDGLVHKLKTNEEAKLVGPATWAITAKGKARLTKEK